ncbi:hypothetical protein FBU30_004947 [Linnemannia zychae]|nr:hypothetical protein FBU30_004947 [Linnemannia zychae]
MRIEHLEAIDSVYESDEDDAGWDVVSDGDGSNINPNDDDNDYSNNMNNNGDDGDNYYDHYQPEMMETSASLCHDSMKSNGFTVSERLQKLNRDNNYTMEEDDADEQSMAIMDMLAQRMAALRLGFV